MDAAQVKIRIRGRKAVEVRPADRGEDQRVRMVVNAFAQSRLVHHVAPPVAQTFLSVLLRQHRREWLCHQHPGYPCLCLLAHSVPSKDKNGCATSILNIPVCACQHRVCPAKTGMSVPPAERALPVPASRDRWHRHSCLCYSGSTDKNVCATGILTFLSVSSVQGTT